MSGSLFVVVAPSGAGKTSLVNELLTREPNIRLSISYTTRAPREGEMNGREYHFTEALEFDAPRFIDLLGTYSDHALLDPASRARLDAAIADLIDSRFGGNVRRRAVTRLFLARRAQ